MNPALVSLEPDIVRFVLELARIGGVVAVAPLPWVNAPNKTKVGLTIALTLLIHTQGSPSASALSTWSGLFLLVTELLLGAAMGLVVRLALTSVEVAGDLMAATMGLSAAQAFDPASGTNDSVLTNLLRHLNLLLAVAVGLHRNMLAALLSSFQALPVGQAYAMQASTLSLSVELGTNVLSVGLRLALPMLAVLLTANLALGFVSRAAPALQIFSVGFAVLLAAGAAVLMVSLPDLAHELVRETDRAVDSLLQVLESLRHD